MTAKTAMPSVTGFAGQTPYSQPATAAHRKTGGKGGEEAERPG